jgi:hypothetical protein
MRKWAFGILAVASVLGCILATLHAMMSLEIRHTETRPARRVFPFLVNSIKTA